MRLTFSFKKLEDLNVLAALLRRLIGSDDVIAKLNNIERLLLMAKADFDTLRNDLRTATNTLGAAVVKVGDRIADLVSKLEAGGMTPAEEAQVLEDFKALRAPLTAVATSLEVMGTNPTTPVPEQPPIVVPGDEGGGPVDGGV